jgi:hypothetical protein
LRLHHQKMSSPCFKVPIGQAEKWALQSRSTQRKASNELVCQQ